MILSSIPRYPRIAEIFGGVGMFRLVFFFFQISLEGCSPTIFCGRCTQFDSHVFQWDRIQIFLCRLLFLKCPTHMCVSH